MLKSTPLTAILSPAEPCEGRYGDTVQIRQYGGAPRPFSVDPDTGAARPGAHTADLCRTLRQYRSGPR